ncbi:uncharacterized protein EI90DRAFT_3039350 [Cantharellus anzutake]|uniref:uncharacterized protein n=1 Tax=Cantharellus anzutake TaxID=1750568 RepID=UPI0019054634|nr:uncharacterized protein EI90DRAFT_3039350 [Cantharellus anzutake]KAF8338842.1 hypothetical protein EI90DRAFT_3039350 [Cantharellus anzutake]
MQIVMLLLWIVINCKIACRNVSHGGGTRPALSSNCISVPRVQRIVTAQPNALLPRYAGDMPFVGTSCLRFQTFIIPMKTRRSKIHLAPLLDSVSKIPWRRTSPLSRTSRRISENSLNSLSHISVTGKRPRN